VVGREDNSGTLRESTDLKSSVNGLGEEDKTDDRVLKPSKIVISLCRREVPCSTRCCSGNRKAPYSGDLLTEMSSLVLAVSIVRVPGIERSLWKDAVGLALGNVSLSSLNKLSIKKAESSSGSSSGSSSIGSGVRTGEGGGLTIRPGEGVL
jgi:hypothetical protein